MRRPRILCVDDDPMNLSILEELLEEEFDLKTAPDGARALELAVSYRPDLILLDIMMPGLNGYETCERLRLLPEARGCKIILVSAKAMTEERLRGYESGADDYVTKPFDPLELLAKIRVFLRLGHLEDVAEVKRRFVTLLDHEMRTPLTKLLAASDLLQDLPELGPDGRGYVGIIRDTCMHLTSVLAQASVLYSLELEQIPLQAQPLPLDEILREVLVGPSSIAQEKGCRIVAEAPPGVQVEADAEQLCHVLRTLLGHAARSAPAGSTVTLRARVEGQHVEVSVEDRRPSLEDGVRLGLVEGFDVNDLAHHSGHVSIDLAVCQSMARLHQGQIEISAVPPGPTILTLRLPRLAGGERNEAAGSDRAAA